MFHELRGVPDHHLAAPRRVRPKIVRVRRRGPIANVMLTNVNFVI